MGSDAGRAIDQAQGRDAAPAARAAGAGRARRGISARSVFPDDGLARRSPRQRNPRTARSCGMRKLRDQSGTSCRRFIAKSRRARIHRCPIRIFSSRVTTSTTKCCRGTLSTITFTNGFCSPNERRRIMSIRARRATSSDAPCAAHARIDCASSEEGRKRKMVHRDFRSARIMALVAAAWRRSHFRRRLSRRESARKTFPRRRSFRPKVQAAPRRSILRHRRRVHRRAGKTWMPAPKGMRPASHHASSRTAPANRKSNRRRRG